MSYRAFPEIKASLACFYFVHVKFFVQRAALNPKFALLPHQNPSQNLPNLSLTRSLGGLWFKTQT
jgi:hypothetical protein